MSCRLDAAPREATLRGMSLIGAIRTLRVAISGDTRRPLSSEFWKPLTGTRVLELGGPSGCFGVGAALPVYPLLKRIDGVQPIARTIWHKLDSDAGNIVEGRRKGDLYITDDLELRMLPDAAYDAVLCSHVIEHIANPLRALLAWRRVSGTGRHLLLVAPHMAGTFDHRRPVTSLSHMVDDFQADTQEDDLTHLDEFLLFHDATRNVRGQADDDFVADLQDNVRTRLLHHHTFTTASLLRLLDRAGLQLSALETRLPHDIYVLGHWLEDGALPDNSRFEVLARKSPFPIDRRAVPR
jgi:SAM-dependent methyltransferase